MMMIASKLLNYFLGSNKSNINQKRDGEESGVVRCQCLKYIYIYLHIQRERGEWCGALSVLEVYT